jgi:transposase
MAKPTYEQLLDVITRKDRQIARKDRQIAQLEARITQLERQNAHLQARIVQIESLLEKATRAGKRQAAPFSKGPPKENPKKPGRKGGQKYGLKARRPLPEQEPDEGIDVPLSEQCEECGGEVQEDHLDYQYQVEIPRRPIIRRFDIHVGQCQQCGRRIQPRHELQTSDAVYPDETGWKVGGLLQWMWAFVTNVATVYVIRPSRGRDVPQEVLGADYDGRMIHDGWSPYDSFVNAIHQQCLEHLLRRASELLEKSSGRALHFPQEVKKFLLDALALRDRREAGRISGHGLAVGRGRLEKRLHRLLDCNRSHEGNRRFRDHLARHREEILTFLYHEDIEATNWPAEQAMRPAVVNRKVFGGNRTSAGARAQEVLGSVFATCNQNAVKALAFLSRLIRLPALAP